MDKGTATSIVSAWLRLAYFLMALAVGIVAAWLALDPASDDVLRWGAGAVGGAALVMLVRLCFIGVVVQRGTLLVRNPLWTHRVPAQKIERIVIRPYDGYWAPESVLGFLNPFNYFESPIVALTDEVTVDFGDGTPMTKTAASLRPPEVADGSALRAGLFVCVVASEIR